MNFLYLGGVKIVVGLLGDASRSDYESATAFALLPEALDSDVLLQPWDPTQSEHLDIPT